MPRERGAIEGEQGAMNYRRGEDGRFELAADADGDLWLPDWPVVNVDVSGAVAYARGLAARDGLPWRLPGELEWEKAARGVDGRCFPWGDTVDASSCCIRDSWAERPMPAVIDGFPVDSSPYGVRGLGGNAIEWCADIYAKTGPAVSGERVEPTLVDGSPDARRSRRGGCWLGFSRSARCANRDGKLPSNRTAIQGFRVVRSFPSSH